MENTAFKAQTYGWKLDHFPIKNVFVRISDYLIKIRSLQPKLFDVNRNFEFPANHPVQSKFSIFSQHSWFRLKLQVLLKFQVFGGNCKFPIETPLLDEIASFQPKSETREFNGNSQFLTPFLGLLNFSFKSIIMASDAISNLQS